MLYHYPLNPDEEISSSRIAQRSSDGLEERRDDRAALLLVELNDLFADVRDVCHRSRSIANTLDEGGDNVLGPVRPNFS